MECFITCTSPAQVRKWVNGGGKLKVGGDVLVGLSRWETLVPKTKETDQLLKNMPEATTGKGHWGMSSTAPRVTELPTNN